MNRKNCLRLALWMLAIAGAAGLRSSASAQQCSCSCDSYVPPHLDVSDVEMNESGAGPTQWLGASVTTAMKGHGVRRGGGWVRGAASFAPSTIVDGVSRTFVPLLPGGVSGMIGSACCVKPGVSSLSFIVACGVDSGRGGALRGLKATGDGAWGSVRAPPLTSGRSRDSPSPSSTSPSASYSASIVW